MSDPRTHQIDKLRAEVQQLKQQLLDVIRLNAEYRSCCKIFTDAYEIDNQHEVWIAIRMFRKLEDQNQCRQ